MKKLIEILQAALRVIQKAALYLPQLIGILKKESGQEPKDQV